MASRSLLRVSRLVLFAIAVSAPLAGYWLESLETGNAKLAIDGLGQDAPISLLAAAAFPFTYQSKGMAWAGRFAGFCLAVIAVWAAGLFFLTTVLPALWSR